MSDSLTDFARARVGAVLNAKYKLERLIGVGGMAAVYAGVHRNGNRVAVKVLHPHIAANGDLRARFLREGYVANKVEHRGAVRVLDDDVSEDGSVFLVMELLNGQPLTDKWQAAGRQLPPPEACELVLQLLEVLAVAHAAGVVHRDIKPDNLFVTRDGVLKVLDFGIARLRESQGAESATRTGHTMGTPAFMPPEQALGRSRDIDGQTDVWAAGATLFSLISGQFVHEAETVAEMVVWAGSRPARSITTVAPDLPSPLAAVIDKSLVFSKAERWPDARSMALALEEAHVANGGAPLHQPRQGARKPPSRMFMTQEAPAVGFPWTGGSAPGAAASPPANAIPSPNAAASASPAAPVVTAPPGPSLPPPPAASAHEGLARGGSTTGGVAHEPSTPAPAPAKRRRPLILGGVALFGAAVVVLLALALRPSPARPAGAAFPPLTTAASAPAPLTSDQTEPAAVAPPRAETTAVPPPAPALAAPPPAAAESAKEAARPEDAGEGPRAVPASPRAPGALKNPKPGAAEGNARPAKAAAKVNCTPPYFIDPAGHRQYKPECLD